MAHLQYMPGDPRLVDQLVYELKSKGIFDQFRKDCIADVDTRPAYQNLRQRVENSVSSFLSRQCWKPDLNKNQLREKLRKHILEGNYLEQGVERIVDQVVNPKVASVFIPQVEDLVYNYLGISRKKTVTNETDEKTGTDDLLPTDLEAVSPGSVKSNEDKTENMDVDVEDTKMEMEETKTVKDEEKSTIEADKPAIEVSPTIHDLTSQSGDEKTVMMHEDINLENIPAPDNSPPKSENVKLENIELPKEPNVATEIPHPDEIPLPRDDKEQFFKPIGVQSDDESSSDSSLRRNMSPLTPIRNYNNENSCDAQQAFENDSDSKSNDKKEPSTFRFAIDNNTPEITDSKIEKKDIEQKNLAYQFNNQININSFNTPLYEDSSNSNNLHIDYESDANSKVNAEKASEIDQNSEDKKDKKQEDKKSNEKHKSSHRSRDSHRHSSSRDNKSNTKQSSSRDSSKHDKKNKDDHGKYKSSHRDSEKSRDRSDKKDSRDSSKHRSSSHKSSSSHRDSKSRKSSSSSQRHSSDKKSDDKKSSSSTNHKEKTERSSEKSSDRSTSDRRDSKSSSHRSDKDKKSSSKSKNDDKDKKDRKEKKEKDTDDHYSLSGRGNHGRRSTDRDSNDGSSSSKGSQNHQGAKPLETKKENKESSSKSDNTSTSGDSTSPSDKDHLPTTANNTITNQKPIRVENHLEVPIASPPRLPFVPDVTLKKPKFAANLEEAKRMIKMRKFYDEEQKRMNQEAALLLEFQANVRPSLSQVYSSIPGPELEFCVTNNVNNVIENQVCTDNSVKEPELIESKDNEVAEIKSFIDNVTEEKDEPSNDIETKDDTEISYSENKPFSQLMDEISQYSKASERNKKDSLDATQDDDDKKRTEYFEITVITEELSETEDSAVTTPPIKHEVDGESDSETIRHKADITKTVEDENFKYFAEHEKFDAEIKRLQYSDFFKSFNEKNSVSNKIHVINCDSYEENILKEVSANFGSFEIINYYKNGHLKLSNKSKNVIKDLSLVSEITLPVDSTYEAKSPSPVLSPVKSECSFELSSDYDAKLEEMVNKTSRQEVMEIILGSVIENMDNPTIDYCMDSSIDNDSHMKRKIEEVESTENNNRQVLKKMRKLSNSDQITSTTGENEEISNINRSMPTRSKYLGRARRVGLPRPRKNNLPNSPSSDKSVENYEQNTPVTPQPNGKFKSVRNKFQRYDTSDLYKPKLHYLSRRNNIT